MSSKKLEGIRRAFNIAFGTDVTLINLDSTPSDIPKWDSLGHVILVAELEKVFDTSFEVDEVMEMEDVAAIVRLLSAKGV